MRILTAPVMALALGIAILSPAGARPIRIPLHFMTMANVRALWGRPHRILPAVGYPPISRWVYPRFIVYFERSLVLRAVITRPWTPPHVYAHSPRPDGGR